MLLHAFREHYIHYCNLLGKLIYEFYLGLINSPHIRYIHDKFCSGDEMSVLVRFRTSLFTLFSIYCNNKKCFSINVVTSNIVHINHCKINYIVQKNDSARRL